MSTPPVTVVGESLVDLVLRPGDTEPVEHPGGSPANVSVGLSRLDHAPTLLTRLGEDERGELVARHLRDNGVDVRSSVAPRTSTALARLDERGSATYEFDLDWDVADLRVPGGTGLLHVGSLAAVLAPGAETVQSMVRDAARAGNVLISYDPNVRPTITPDRDSVREHVLRTAAHAHIVKCSEEDLEFLFPGTPPEALPQMFAEAALVAVTHGGDGVFWATDHHTGTLAPPQIEMVDSVGAGDAFMAGLLDGALRAGVGPRSLDALADEAATEQIMRRATTVAAITCARAGANPPTTAEVDDALAA
ncbi:carbohydrate kinase [Allosaccharopolyspora coralli]|uniref:Carbohydrate kinase n=1 Tax=Allosaccharopolyspora coralli TaxID=2665642 RepID=A0A5Q3Q2G3_9PSEU|nr:carbohydrate kinase [Allosaccharopolyspora coralli]QGK68778.1 carbohydrate kinase [Allosaccharopolyspora coralli]